MKRLLFVIPSMRMGGAEKALVSLLKSLDPDRVSVDLFLFEQGGILQKQIPAWVRILPEDIVTRAMTLELRFYWKDLIRHGHLFAAAARLWIYLKGMQQSKLHRPMGFSWKTISRFIPRLDGNYDTAISFLEGTTAFYLIDKVSAHKKIGWIHTDLGKRRVGPEEGRYYRQFEEIVTITEACRAALLESFALDPQHVHVIENITIPAEIRAAADEPMEHPWSAERKHLLTVARLEEQKGIDLALEACKQLASARSDFQWHVLGDGSLRQWLEKEIASSHLEQFFLLEGVKSNPYPYMKAAYAIVQPSRIEGKSIVLDEAKLLGKAILTTNYPSVGDQIVDRFNGLILDIRADAIASAVSGILDDENLIRSLEKNNSEPAFADRDPLRPFYQII